MSIKYTKKGLEITHSTGVVTTHTIADLTRLKKRKEQSKIKIDDFIEHINDHIAKLKW